MNKIIKYTFVLLLILTTIIGIMAYQFTLGSKITPPSADKNYLYIPTGSEFDDVVKILLDQKIIPNEEIFRRLAKKMNYIKSPMRSGRFEIKNSWSVVDLIRHLRNGKQAPVMVVVNNARLLEDVAGRTSRFFEPDSAALMTLFQDEAYLDEIGYTIETLMSVFIPDTYEFYWNTSPKKFMERMIKEHNAFWAKDNRLKKAADINLNPAEVYTLASIVERETLQNSEKKRMAGVYLNRLKTGMLLQADPTSVFATRDFAATRVTDYHTKYDSPYNTYMYKGLPPGPISMASKASIDAVLNAETHKYVYFCAKGDGSGFHNFAKTLSAHNQNAKLYRKNVAKRRK